MFVTCDYSWCTKSVFLVRIKSTCNTHLAWTNTDSWCSYIVCDQLSCLFSVEKNLGPSIVTDSYLHVHIPHAGGLKHQQMSMHIILHHLITLVGSSTAFVCLYTLILVSPANMQWYWKEYYIYPHLMMAGPCECLQWSILYTVTIMYMIFTDMCSMGGLVQFLDMNWHMALIIMVRVS